MVVYGIKNCNTVKNALQWLDGRAIQYDFHDYKSKGTDSEQLRSWCKQVGWESLVNKRGTTWRQLDPEIQLAVKDEASAIKLMSEKPSVIKRPLIEDKGKVVVLGFDESSWSKIFG